MQKINTSNMDVYELDTTKPYLIIVKATTWEDMGRMANNAFESFKKAGVEHFVIIPKIISSKNNIIVKEKKN